MRSVLAIKERVKQKLGELWWYAVVFFVAQRSADVISAFIGVWLVPKYVPQSELGAILPLMQVGGMLGFPVSVLVLVLSKYVSVFATRGEYGKLKRLLRDALGLLMLILIGTMCLARGFMPFVFERMRVEDGRLGLLVIFAGVVASIAVFFSSTLQALKMFTLASLINLFAAPVRLIALLIFLPIRALSGYFVGQIVPVLFSIVVAMFFLRSYIVNKKVDEKPYLGSDGLEMLHFLSFVFVGGLLALPQGVVEPFVIRHRLPDVDSAAYYMISRFAEIGSYVGFCMTPILFPLAAEQHTKGVQSQRLVLSAVCGSLFFGVALACFFYFFGARVLLLVPNGEAYSPYIPNLAALTIILSIRTVSSVFIVNECAHQRYSVYWWNGLLVLMESFFLYVITGFDFFRPWVPALWIDWVSALNPARLDFVLWVMFVHAFIWLLCMGIHLFVQRRRVNESCMQESCNSVL